MDGKWKDGSGNWERPRRLRCRRLYSVTPPNHVKKIMARLFAVSCENGEIDSHSSKGNIVVAGLQFSFGIRRTGQMCVPLEIELTWILRRKTGDKDGFTGVKVGWTTYKLDETMMCQSYGRQGRSRMDRSHSYSSGSRLFLVART